MLKLLKTWLEIRWHAGWLTYHLLRERNMEKEMLHARNGVIGAHQLTNEYARTKQRINWHMDQLGKLVKLPHKVEL